MFWGSFLSWKWSQVHACLCQAAAAAAASEDLKKAEGCKFTG